MFKTFSQLTKFGIVIFVLLAGLAGYATGFQIETPFDYKDLIYFLGGLYFLSSGSLALNQVQEWRLDQKMPRTKNRPVARGQIKPLAAGILSCAMIFVGVNMLFAQSTTAGVLGILSVILYNVLYTKWWKPQWAFAAVPGAIPGALPITIGYAVNNSNIFTSESIYLFLIMFFWQMPHFWTLAIKYKDDYAAGGVPTLPVQLGVKKTLYHIGLYTFAYAGVAMSAPFFLQTSWVYILFIFPFAFFLVKEFFRLYSSGAKERWFAFFMWTNISMLVFIFVPVVDKWSFLFFGRG